MRVDAEFSDSSMSHSVATLISNMKYAGCINMQQYEIYIAIYNCYVVYRTESHRNVFFLKVQASRFFFIIIIHHTQRHDIDISPRDI